MARKDLGGAIQWRLGKIRKYNQVYMEFQLGLY